MKIFIGSDFGIDSLVIGAPETEKIVQCHAEIEDLFKEVCKNSSFFCFDVASTCCLRFTEQWS